MDNKIQELAESFQKEISSITNPDELERIRLAYLGKKGSVTELLKNLRDASD